MYNVLLYYRHDLNYATAFYSNYINNSFFLDNTMKS